jgi:hypothetical protein
MRPFATVGGGTMSNESSIQSSQTILPGTAPATAKKFIHAAALAAALVPLGAVVVDAAVISCVTSEVSGGSGGCFGVTGSYTSGGGEDTNTWKFFTDASLTTLIYTLEIKGDPANDFSLDVDDRQVPFLNLESFNIAFPDAECIPMADETTCVIFDVFEDGEANWLDGYYLEMRWFAPDDSVMKPPDDGLNHIFKSEDGFLFNDVLAPVCPGEGLGTNCYNPDVDPIDPALGGRGDSFTSFLGGRSSSVPEPATLSLIGMGIGAALYKRRRNRGR